MSQPHPRADPDLGQLAGVFGRIGILSFGGPAAQIALMHRTLVDERQWLDEREYLQALSFCMLLPGPEAMQLATFAGWKLRGVPGGLIAGLLFVLPGAAVVLALSILYAYLGQLPLVQALFLGVQAAVVIIVVQALLRLGQRALRGAGDWVIAGLAFLGIFALSVPFPVIIAAAALVGALRTRAAEAAPNTPAATPRTFRTVLIWAAIWLIPLAALWWGGGGLLAEIGLFFSKLAVVTFGGAYAVLAYMTQEVVQDYSWLTTAEMVDGLGLAETTPGPLILVTQFVGFLAAFREGGLALGLAGAAVTLWMTFTPCFLWIFAGAPWMGRIAQRPRLSGALAAITAAVVGVILNLSLWFAAHVFFDEVGTAAFGPASLIAPAPSTLNVQASAIALAAAAMIFGARLGLVSVLAACAALGAGLSAIG